jgi:hypothetical protein
LTISGEVAFECGDVFAEDKELRVHYARDFGEDFLA